MNRKFKKIIRRSPLYFVLILAFLFVIQATEKLDQSKNVFSGSISGSIEDITLIKERPPYRNSEVQDINIDVQSAISVAVDQDNNNKVLFKKDEQKKLSVASISKLMTAVIVLDNIELSQKVEISKEVQKLGGDREPLKAGESFFAKDLLYAMLIGSDNSAAGAFSELIGEERFIELMNGKAEEIGLFDTSFLNPTGLSLDNFSTSKDLSKLAQYLFKEYPLILKITTTPEFDLYTADGKVLHKITNTDKLLKESSDFQERIIGSKTGETRTAGECLLLVLKAKDDKSYIINIILNSKDRFGDTKKIIDWLDSAYQW